MPQDPEVAKITRMKDRRVFVKCDIHGPMQYRDHLYVWKCVGFDGEGCVHVYKAQPFETHLTDEEIVHIMYDKTPPSVHERGLATNYRYAFNFENDDRFFITLYHLDN